MRSVIVLPTAIPLRNRQRQELQAGFGLLFLFQGVGPLLLALTSVFFAVIAPSMGLETPAQIRETSVVVSSHNRELSEIFSFGLVFSLTLLVRSIGGRLTPLVALFFAVAVAGTLHHWFSLSFQQALAVKLATRAMLTSGLLILGFVVQRWAMPEVSRPAWVAMILGMLVTLAEMSAGFYPTVGVLTAGVLTLAQVAFIAVTLFRLWRLMPGKMVPG